MIPLISFVGPANVHEGKFLKSMLHYVQSELSTHVDIVVGDMGYISSKKKMELRKQSHIAVLTRVRENMYPPQDYIDYGRPECPEGIPLSWDGYNSETAMHCSSKPLCGS
jgi:hypothetical protein